MHKSTWGYLAIEWQGRLLAYVPHVPIWLSQGMQGLHHTDGRCARSIHPPLVPPTGLFPPLLQAIHAESCTSQFGVNLLEASRHINPSTAQPSILALHHGHVTA